MYQFQRINEFRLNAEKFKMHNLIEKCKEKELQEPYTVTSIRFIDNVECWFVDNVFVCGFLESLKTEFNENYDICNAKIEIEVVNKQPKSLAEFVEEIQYEIEPQDIKYKAVKINLNEKTRNE